jgi:hypothetical protein
MANRGSRRISARDRSSGTCLEVECDRDWRTREGGVNGWAGFRRVDIRITHTSNGLWTLNRQVVPDMPECVDLDLGFPPATNPFQLRRSALQSGNPRMCRSGGWMCPSARSKCCCSANDRRADETYWLRRAARNRFRAALSGSSLGMGIAPTSFDRKSPRRTSKPSATQRMPMRFARNTGLPPPSIGNMIRRIEPRAAGYRVHSSFLWSAQGPLGTGYARESGLVGPWQEWSSKVRGQANEAGHSFPEEVSEQTAEALAHFFAS